MKKKTCMFFAFLFLVIITGCVPATFELQLEGVNRTEVFGHNRKMKIGGGMLTGGKYSGPGVENGYFTPSKAGNGTHTIKYSKMFHGTETAQITVYGVQEIPKPCSRCNGEKTIICPECDGKGKIMT